jgi:NNP family nitrate/nitrite transporter-like MFS transporter
MDLRQLTANARDSLRAARVLAIVMRPVGGLLADRIGGRAILLWIFPAVAAMAIFMACPLMSTFTLGALGMAAAIGLGNGAGIQAGP